MSVKPNTAAPHTLRPCLTSAMSAMLAGTTILASMLVQGVSAHASDLIVKYDQSQLLRLARPVREIIIGNPTIADVAIQTNTLLVITGKSFGITNIIALDQDRNIIQDQRVIVQRDQVKIVNLQKGAKRESYNCSPQCNPTVTVGDDSAYFDQVAKHAERKMKMSEGSGDGGRGGPAQ